MLPPLDVHGGQLFSQNDPARILVRGTNWIGDAVMTLPALASLRATCPKAHISVLAKPWVADLYRLCPDIDEVLIYERPGRHDGLSGFIRLANDLRRLHFDAAVLLQNAFEAALLTYLARIPLRAGYDSDARCLLLTHAVRRTPAVRAIHQTRYYLELVRALGGRETGAEIKISITGEMKKISDDFLQARGLEGENLFGISPGATYGPAKRWFPERFADVADRLVGRYGGRVLLFGSPADQESTHAVQDHSRQAMVDLAGKTSLISAIALIASCRLFLSNDSGLMHVAAALGVPTVAIFGSTNPVTTSPAGPETTIVRQELPCSPCLKTDCPSDFACMTRTTADEVFAACERILCTRPA